MRIILNDYPHIGDCIWTSCDNDNWLVRLSLEHGFNGLNGLFLIWQGES